MFKEDTIAAIATPRGAAAIGKIRISGRDAISAADNIFKGSNSLRDAKSHTVHYGNIFDPEKNKIIDEVLAIVMKKPSSFTGEDVVEFDCHGGMVPLRKVLEVILARGVRMAEPGEFSKRAFINGKIDMAQAEGIMEVINAETEKSLDIAVDHLRGKLSGEIKEIKEEVMTLIAHLEASIDFPEDEIEGFNSSELKERVNFIEKKIHNLLATAEQGKIYREGIKTVITGKPNVGKSSLLNYFLQENRAIVTDVPGTTRDVIEEVVNIDGIPLRIFDTAGIRKTEDEVEKVGVERSRRFIEDADLILFMLDIDQGITVEDKKIYNIAKNKPLIILINKTDLEKQVDKKNIRDIFSDHPILLLSVKREEGLDKLKKLIIDEVLDEKFKTDEDIMLTRVRHKNALKEACKALEKVNETLKKGLPHDFLTIDLKKCLDNLGKITGETIDEDIVERIFADFCLGK